MECYIAPGKSNYDMIIGRRTMKKLGIKLDFDTATVHWREHSSPMKPMLTAAREVRFKQVQQQFLASLEDEEDNLAPQGLELQSQDPI